jgi:GT2 family glycosyltransferase
MKVSLIMPFYGKWQMTHQRLMEIYQHVSPPTRMEIILINDNPDDREPNTAGWWQQETRLKVRYFHNKKNLGFGGSMNKGAEKAKGDILIFFSNDVVVSGDFVAEIIGALTVDDQRFIGGRYLDFNTGWNHISINRKMTLFPYVEGWLIACTREVWEDLGGFDPIYYPYDYEDIDLSTMAIHKGYKLFGLSSKYLRHLSGVTIRNVNPYREGTTLENKQKFQTKWSEILK